MPVAKDEVLEVAGRQVTISNPDKIFFPKTGHTKLDLVRYYMAVGEGALRGVWGRPMALKRFVNGAEGQAFFQKRAPSSRDGRKPRYLVAFQSTPGSSLAGLSPKSDGPRWHWRGRSNAARRRSPPAGGGKRSATASSSTTTRTPRTEPSRLPIRSGQPPMPASPRRSAGTRSRPARRRPSPSTPC